MYKLVLLTIFAGFLIISCQKQSNLNGNALLSLSADTVRFDTVFTSVGSVTQKVKLINYNNQAVGVSDIELMGGIGSPFIINIDGTPGPVASNLSIPANDSLYIFVTVYFKPGTIPNSFFLQDSIRIHYNGINQFIQLTAWAQNAHFLDNQVLKGNITWTNDLPYVITGSLRVDSNASLNIEAGTHIYLHANAPFLVDGSLQVLGQASDSLRVHFTGDRLDQPYASYPGSWPGIYFRQTSKDNMMNYAILENGYHTLVTEGPSQDANPKLTLNQCIINNSFLEGILCVQSSVKAVNCLVSNCGENIVIGLGGSYQFEHCTIASYSNNFISHQQPVLTVSNSGSDGNQVFVNDLNAIFTNCIFWGSESIPDEAIVSKQGTTAYQVLFDHCILKQKNFPVNADSISLQLNADPQFLETGTVGNIFNFHLTSASPAVDQGRDLGILIDLDGNTRPVNMPDLGCYERQ